MKKGCNILIFPLISYASARQDWVDLEQSLRVFGFQEVAFPVTGKSNSGPSFHFRGRFTEKDMAGIRSALQSHESQ
jgi:hypothetical protein